MAMLNIIRGRRWVGMELLGRRGPVSQNYWDALLEMGMPIGVFVNSPMICTEAVQKWFSLVAAGGRLPKERPEQEVPQSTPRKRGRPRKHEPLG